MIESFFVTEGCFRLVTRRRRHEACIRWLPGGITGESPVKVFLSAVFRRFGAITLEFSSKAIEIDKVALRLGLCSRMRTRMRCTKWWGADADWGKRARVLLRVEVRRRWVRWSARATKGTSRA